MMTRSASVSFFKPDFQDFLYAPLDANRDEMPLSVLSALARLGIDPWTEAAELTELPIDAAKERLASLLARLPGGCWAQAESRIIVSRLVQLLPHHRAPKVRSPVQSKARTKLTRPVVAKLLIIAALTAAAWLAFATSRDFSTRGDQSTAPSLTSNSLPQSPL
jgi:hypothetical protein